jgi:perosamine synthetase
MCRPLRPRDQPLPLVLTSDSPASPGAALALYGGSPVRTTPLQYGRQDIGEDDIAAVGAVLRSEWLTTGPVVHEFERAFAAFCGAPEAVAVSSGTAALHAALHALGVGPGDEVIVPPMTFAATANAAVYLGATPVFADVDPGTLLLDPERVVERISAKTRAIVGVDYAGQPCDWDALEELARAHDIPMVADACHAVGARVEGRAAGTLADLTVFSLHPVKHFTTGEGGMITTSDPDLARRMRDFRNHGITTDARARCEAGAWFYEMVELGYNYRITDFQCALGLSQLRKVPGWLERRRGIAARYDDALVGGVGFRPLAVRSDVEHAYHLYVVRTPASFAGGRDRAHAALHAEGIAANVHYIPVHLHPFYRERFGTGPGLCPVAEAAYGEILSLPLFPAMVDGDVDDVLAAVAKVTAALVDAQ